MSKFQTELITIFLEYEVNRMLAELGLKPLACPKVA